MVPDSPLRQPVWFRRDRWRFPGVLPFILGFLLVCVELGAGTPGYGFDSFKKFQKSKETAAFKLEAVPGRDRVRPGDTFWLYLVGTLDKGWHMYSIEKQTDDATVATRIELESSDFPLQGEWQETPPRLVRDEVLETILKTHSGRVEFTHLLQVPKDLKPGVYPISGTLHFRSCDNRVCTLPQAIRFQTRVIVETGPPGR